MLLLIVAAKRASWPPMQNPTTPSREADTSGRAARNFAAPARSFSARSMLRAMKSFPASSGSPVVVPWYRSGANAENPSAAKRSHTFLMWATSPHHS